MYKRYASLFFVAAVGKDDNEVCRSLCVRYFFNAARCLNSSQLLTLEIIHHYVEGTYVPNATKHHLLSSGLMALTHDFLCNSPG